MNAGAPETLSPPTCATCLHVVAWHTRGGACAHFSDGKYCLCEEFKKWPLPEKENS